MYIYLSIKNVYAFLAPPLGTHLFAVEEHAYFNYVIGFTSGKYMLTVRCNHAGQAFIEEPD